MKRIFLLQTLLIALMSQTQVMAQAQIRFQENGNIILDDFANETVGTVPSKWFVRDGNVKVRDLSPEKRSRYNYRISEDEGRRFIRYSGSDAMHIGLPLYETQGVSLKSHPILSWEWRVHSLPKNAMENDENSNDAAASIYVVYELSGLFKTPKVIRYTWSSSLPKNTIISKGKQKIVVLESGSQRIRQWVKFERNIYDDYVQLFGQEPPDKPLAILILSDANNTKSFALADYGTLMLKRNPITAYGSK